MRPITITPLLLLIALTISACGLTDLFSGGSEAVPNADTPPSNSVDNINLTGTIVGTVDDCAFDGICALIVETETGNIQVNWAEGMMQCLGEYTGEVTVGDSVEVFAAPVEPGIVSICGGEQFYIRGTTAAP